MEPSQTWLIVGASRGIGLEFVHQILANGHRVVATVRSSSAALDVLVQEAPDRAKILTCDVSSNESITVGYPLMTAPPEIQSGDYAECLCIEIH